MFEEAPQVNVGLVETPVAPLEGEGPEGVPGVGQGAGPVVKYHTDPEVEFPQLFLATTFQ